MFKKFKISVVLVIVLSLMMGQFAFASNDSLIDTEEHYIYNVENYLKSLPFALRRGDEIIVKNIFKKLVLAYENDDIELADELYESLYDVIGEYWMHKVYLKRMLPVDQMRKSVDKMFTQAQKEAFDKLLKDLDALRKKNDFKGYFAKINEIYKFYYDNLGKTIGDSHDELLLITYIKDGDKITDDDLINYKFNDYLEILPFNIKDKDYPKANLMFDKIVKKLEESLKIEIKKDDSPTVKKEKQVKIDEIMKDAKLLTKDLYDFLAPYWLTQETLDNLVPHKKYIKEFIHTFSHKHKLKAHNAYINVEKKLELAKKDDKAFDAYFKSIHDYYNELGEIIREYYDDVFDEIIFVQ